MDEAIPKKNTWLRYGLLLLGISSVLAVSIGAGYWLVKPKQPIPLPRPSGLRSVEPPLVTPTIGPAKPVTLAVTSELGQLSLEDTLDTAALARWWEIIGVDSHALPLKELGGYTWYTPTQLRIVFRDIGPLSKQQRWGLYKPTATSPEAMPIAGYATVYDAAQEILTYEAWYDPAVLIGELTPADIQDSVNRILFELLYEGAVGSTSLTPDNYQAKSEQAFPVDDLVSSTIQIKPAGSTLPA